MMNIIEATLMSAHNIPFSITKKNKITQSYHKSATMGLFPTDSRTSFTTAVVNESSLFESLKVYCVSKGDAFSHYAFPGLGKQTRPEYEIMLKGNN